MELHKRTYSLPAQTLEQFESAVPAAQRSTILAGLLRAWLDEQQREALEREIIEGCREMAEVYLQVEQEYHPLEEEVQRGLDSPAEARRHRARPSRSGRRK